LLVDAQHHFESVDMSNCKIAEGEKSFIFGSWRIFIIDDMFEVSYAKNTFIVTGKEDATVRCLKSNDVTVGEFEKMADLFSYLQSFTERNSKEIKRQISQQRRRDFENTFDARVENLHKHISALTEQISGCKQAMSFHEKKHLLSKLHRELRAAIRLTVCSRGGTRYLSGTFPILQS
jgi:hypothetical protein